MGETDTERAEARAAALRALGHPIRLRAVAQFGEGVKTSASKLLPAMPDVGVSNLSYHLHCLADAGYVQPAERVQHRGAFEQLYEVTPAGLKASKSLGEIAKLLGIPAC